MTFEHFTKVADREPPELCDLLVCNLEPAMEDRLYDIAQFARKGSPLRNEFRPQGGSTEERLLDAVLHPEKGVTPAPATGYYHYVCNEETGLCEWRPLGIRYEHSGYMIINPEEEISAMNKIVTCEQVSSGHVDKVCDQIADAIVTDCLTHDENSRVAVECLLKNDELIIAGEITSAHEPDYADLVGIVFRRIGLDRLMKGINLNVMVSRQSPDIALGVDKGGAGDQGIMYGYATNETEEMLPIPFAVATAFIRKLEDLKCPMLLPDAKAQVSYDYANKRVTTFLCSVQHTEDCDVKDFRPLIESLMVLTAAEYGLNSDFEKLVNPTGRFVVGGSTADTGVTGRKLACDTYGGVGRIGGGALCVDADTEYLTKEGWKRIDHYNGTDLVGQYNNGALEFVQPLAYVVNPAEAMYHAHSQQSLDMMLSPMHDVVLETSKGNLIKKQAQQIFDDNGVRNGDFGFVPTSFTFDRVESDVALTDDEIRLQTAFCADGTIIRGKTRDRVRVKKEQKKERMRMLLNVTHTPFTESTDNDFSIFWFTPPIRSKMLHECFAGANTAQMKVIAEEVQKWDGTNRVFRTTHKEEADFIQFVFMAAYGASASIRANDRTGEAYGSDNQYERKSILYEVYAKHSKKTQLKRGKVEEGGTECERVYPCDGKMYCFTMPSGMLVLRRNNRVFITGNCGKDPTKVDRSGAYMARKIAKDLVNAGYCDRCEVQLAYAIGKADPVSVTVDDFGTGHVCGDFYQRFIETNYDLTPSGIIKYLRLKKMDYNLVSSCGHFGFTPAPWELDEETVNRVYGEIED